MIITNKYYYIMQNPFKENYIIQKNVYSDIELILYLTAMQGDCETNLSISSMEDYIKYSNVAQKYKLHYKLEQHSTRSGGSYYEINIFFPYKQNDDNFIQNKYFEIKKSLDLFSLDDHYDDKFHNTNIFKKINQVEGNIKINMNEINLNDLSELNLYGQHRGYNHSVNGEEIQIYKFNPEFPHYDSTKTKEYLIQKGLHKMNSDIFYELYKNKQELKKNKSSYTDPQYEKEFWRICEKFLKEKGMCLEFYEELDNIPTIGSYYMDYIRVTNIKSTICLSKI